MDEPRCATCGLVMTPKNAKLRPELFYCDGCLPVMFRPVPKEHTSNAPVTTQADALWLELNVAKGTIAALAQQRDAALAERDRLLVNNLRLAEERDAAEAERDRLRQKYADIDAIYDQACGEHIRLRDAARAFLDTLDGHLFSQIALRGPVMDALREACHE